MKTFNVSILIVSIGLLLAALALVVVAQNGRNTPTAPASIGTAFTYQGTLTDNGQPADGAYDLQFKLYDAASGGSQVGSTVTLDNAVVTAGLFMTELDFGPVFTGEPRYLEIATRPRQHYRRIRNLATPPTSASRPLRHARRLRRPIRHPQTALL